MKIAILNGNTDGNNEFESYMNELDSTLKKQNHETKHLKLREMNIKFCTGCWGCWVKTPGECIVPDDSRTVSAESINSDLVLFASPITMGFPTSLLKKAMDKMIPLVHPYIEIVDKECHHKKRYEKYPKLSLLLEKNNFTDDEDIKIISDIFHRLAKNFRSTLELVTFTDKPAQEVCNEINNI